MMMNSSQQMDRWKIYFDNPKDSRLGLMNNAYNIGKGYMYELNMRQTLISYLRCCRLHR